MEINPNTKQGREEIREMMKRLAQRGVIKYRGGPYPVIESGNSQQPERKHGLETSRYYANNSSSEAESKG